MRNLFMYFFRTFTFTGILNVLPQSFLMIHFPSNRSWLLPVFLMLYSVSGVVGLWWSRKFLRKNHRWSPLSHRFGQGLVFATALVTNLTLLTLFEVGTWPGFLASLVILAFTLEASFNGLDHALTARLSGVELGRHSARASIAQLLGVCVAPMSFTLGYSNPHATWVLTAMCVLFTGLSYWSLSSSVVSRSSLVTPANATADEPADEFPDSRQNRRDSRHQRVDQVYVAYVLSMYCAAFLFTAYGIFMLSDFYRISQALTYGGWMIAMMNFSSIVGAVGYGAVMRRRRDPSVTLLGGASATALLLFAILLFAMRLNFHLYFILILACMAGIPYGCFLVMSRDYASKRTLMTGNHVLSLYNMSGDSAAITAFLVSLVVTLSLEGRHGTGYITALIVTIIAFLVVALVASFGIPLLKKQSIDPDWEGALR